MTWDTATARDVTFTVQVNGVTREHQRDGITWAQDITSDLPSTVTAGGRLATRTGAIVWAKQRPIETRTPSPWHQGPHWIPTVGDAVTIDAHDGQGNTHRVFTGVIDTVEGDAFGNRSSKIVAPLNGGNSVIRRQAQTQVGRLWSGNIGMMGTTPVWVVSETARALGYASVPPAPPVSQLILDAPLQGSTYVYHQGSYRNAYLSKSQRLDYPELQPVWSSGDTGFGVGSALLEWVPDTGQGTGNGAVGVSMLVNTQHHGDAAVRVEHGANNVNLRVSGTRRVHWSVVVNGVGVSGTMSASVPTGGPHRVSMIARAGIVRLRINDTEEVANAASPGGNVSLIRLTSEIGGSVSGLQVWHPATTTDLPNQGWTPTAHYRYGTGTFSTALTPSIRDERARDVLDGYADALLSPLWVDGNGHLQVATGKALHEQTPSLTVDALRDVSDLSYTMSLLDHRPTVEVTYAHAHQSNTTASEPRTQVWRGSGISVSPGTPEQVFVEIPDDEEWIGLSDPVSATRLMWPDGNQDAFYQNTGSWWGFRYESTDTTEFMSDKVTQLVETLTPWAWKVTYNTTEPNGAQAKTPSQYSTIPMRFRDVDLPVYRARALVKYEDRTVAVSGAGATPDGVLSHDAGKWITHAGAATELATWVHTMVGTPTPVLDGLRVRFDPRLDVGIKITVDALGVFGAKFEALVLSVDHDPGGDTTTVTARVTQVTTYTETLDEVEYAHIGQSLAEWDNARAGLTLDTVAADPYTTA